MAETQTRTGYRRAVLAADAGLLTAAAAGLALEPGALQPGAFGLLGSALLWIGAGAIIFGPLLVWTLHGRHVAGPSTAGAAGGFVLATLVVFAALFVLKLAFGSADPGMPSATVVAAAVVVGAYLAAAAWLDTQAVRDLWRGRRHVLLDVLRLLATAAYVAVVAVVAAWMLGATDPAWPDRVPILLGLVAPGALGAAAAAVADLVAADVERRSHAPLSPGA